MKALIFDVDGTLAETEELHREAFNRAFAEAGMGWMWSRADYRRLLTTTGGKERIARHARETGAGDQPVAELHAAKNRHFAKAMASGRIGLRPGVARLIDEARAGGLALAIATTTSPENVEALSMAVFGRSATQVFDVIAAGDMVAAKKPAPDVYRLALRMLDLPAPAAIAFEDSANGVVSARGAGLEVVMARGIYTSGDSAAGACLVADSLADLGGLAGLRRLMAVLAAAPPPMRPLRPGQSPSLA